MKAPAHDHATDRHSPSILGTARGGALLAGGRLYTYVVRFFTALLLARLLGASEYGTLNLALSAAFTAAAFGTLGVDSAAERYVAVLRRRGDTAAVRGTVRLAILATLAASTLVGIGLLTFASQVATEVFDEPTLAPLLRVAGLLIPLVALLSPVVSTERGLKRMDFAALTDNVVLPTTKLAMIAIVAAFGLTAMRAAWVTVAAYAIAIAVGLALINRELPVWRSGDSDVRVREIAAFSFPFWVSGMLTKVRKNLQTLLLGSMSSLTNVGIFTLVANANLLGRITTLSVSAAVRPIAAELIDADDRVGLKRIYLTATRWTLLTNIPVLIVMVTLSDPLLALFGESFGTGASALIILAFAEFTNAATGICGAIVDMSGQNRMKLINSAVWLTVTLGANIILIPRYGLIGAAVSVLIATSTINLIRVAELWWIYRILPWSWRLWKPLVAGAVTFAAASWSLAQIGTDLNVVGLAIGGAAIGSVYVGLIAALGFEPDDRMILGRLKVVLRRGSR